MTFDSSFVLQKLFCQTKVLVLVIPVILMTSCSRSEFDFCLAVERQEFKKVEKYFKKQLKTRTRGTEFDNGPGSGIQITHQYNLDTIVFWLKSIPCIDDATWDKCQTKISIYPGFSSVGFKMNSQKGLVEKCFSIQEGTTGTVDIFGWRPHLFKAQNKLVYKKMYDCPGFVDEQLRNCRDIK